MNNDEFGEMTNDPMTNDLMTNDLMTNDLMTNDLMTNEIVDCRLSNLMKWQLMTNDQ